MWRRGARDVVWRAHVGNLRVSAVMARDTIAEGARRWELTPSALPSRLWAEYMVGTVMLSSFYKGEERIQSIVRAPTNEEIYVEALAVGEVRGKATLLDESDASVFAKSELQVSKILYGSTKPYTTTVPATGVAEVDWQTFYDVSEQVPTAVRIDHLSTPDMLRCGGLTIQQMPESAPHERHYELSDLRFDSVPFVIGDIAQNTDLIEYLNELIPSADLTEKGSKKVPLDFFCRCSKKTFSHRLAGLGADYLNEMIHDNKDVELSCHFCNEIYPFSVEDLRQIEPTRTA